jgi:hypothetical protein
MMGDVVMRGKRTHPNVKGVFPADLTAKGLRSFGTHHEKAFLSSKQWVSYREFFGTEHKCHASSTLDELRRQLGG